MTHTIYILEAGEYYDEREVVAAFSTIEKATEYSYLYPDAVDIIKLELDVEYPEIPKEHAIYKYTYNLHNHAAAFQTANQETPTRADLIKKAQSNTIEKIHLQTAILHHIWLFAKSKEEAIQKGAAILASKNIPLDTVPNP